MAMSIESGALGAIIAKYGWLKLFTLGASVSGAFLMAIFRPPKSRKEMMLQAIVALGCSILFGDTLANFLDGWFDFINKDTSSWPDWMQFVITVHAILGALSWGIFGGIAHLRDKVSEDPLQAAKDVKDIL